MNGRKTFLYVSAVGLFVLWAVIFFIPILVIVKDAFSLRTWQLEPVSDFWQMTIKSFGLSFLIGVISVVLGFLPGKLLAVSRRHQFLIFFLLMLPLVMPPYVLQYAWRILYSPTTALGSYIGAHRQLSKLFEIFVSSAVMILWFWPLAALLIAQGWQRIDKDVLQSASMETGGCRVFWHIILPQLAVPILLAFGVCFVLCLSEFTTFHLAGFRTIGTELAVVYQLTGSEAAVARASWPVVFAAAVVAVVLANMLRTQSEANLSIDSWSFQVRRGEYFVMFILLAVSFVIPVFLLISSIKDLTALKQFFQLHSDDIGWSALSSAVAAVLAYVAAMGTMLLEKIGRIGRGLFYIVCITIFTAMLLPAGLVAVTILKIMAIYYVPDWLRQSFLVVSIGLSIRFTAVALIVLVLLRTLQQKELWEMARLDGASAFEVFRHISLPQLWRPFVGIFLIIFMLGVSETAATMILLPAGVGNFAQFLLNQMHYARDQQVIAACVVLIGLFIVAVIFFVLLIRATTFGRKAFLILLAACTFCFTSCDKKGPEQGVPRVLFVFGGSGGGDGEFLYPRAIDLAPDGSVFVADKTGRIQRFTSDGKFLSKFTMSLIELGKPTGISFGPDDNLYVADTHYSRVIVFAPDGRIIRQFGKFGQEGGCFIYPTDVAFADGRIFVSEYGGDDRVSVFDPNGNFLYSFGSQGSGEGQFSRPAALCVDKERKILYVADACNHRIAVYDFYGKLQRYIGSLGKGAGELCYPYGLAFLAGGDLAVCEYGNNRIQVFAPDGKSVAVYGRAGRGRGELAYPWSLAVDGGKRAFVVDAGNNRIQVWQL